MKCSPSFHFMLALLIPSNQFILNQTKLNKCKPWVQLGYMIPLTRFWSICPFKFNNFTSFLPKYSIWNQVFIPCMFFNSGYKLFLTVLPTNFRCTCPFCWVSWAWDPKVGFESTFCHAPNLGAWPAVNQSTKANNDQPTKINNQQILNCKNPWK